ncbi:MAG: glycosyltransferase family 2 protein [Betaproteobacteria bacterium]|nr:glycosyltransferase family 2 protein [Betaproteobacteria bacterium]
MMRSSIVQQRSTGARCVEELISGFYKKKRWLSTIRYLRTSSRREVEVQLDHIEGGGAAVPLTARGDELVPAVSVIVPAYNRASLLGEAIASVLAQSFADFEILIVDDGSTDDTERVVHEFVDSRIIYLKQENKGRSCARNAALDISRGRFIAFLDSDDLYLPGKLAMQVEYLDSHPHIDMLYTSAYCIDSSGNVLDERYSASVSGRIYRSIAFFRPVTITLPTVMARRELFDKVGKFDENMYRFEDTDMWRRISKIAHIEALPMYSCKLRTHSDNSLSSQDPDQIIAAIDYYARKVAHEDSLMGAWVLRSGLGALYYYYARAFQTVPAWKHRSNRLLRTSCRYWPFFAVRHVVTRLGETLNILPRRVFYSSVEHIYPCYRKLKAVISGKK